MDEGQDRPLNPAALTVFERRGISAETILRHGIYTARRAPKDADDKEPIPDVKGAVLCYPYLDIAGKEQNCKFSVRTKTDKMYWQRPGRDKILYNLPILADPALTNGDQFLLMVEGENDCLAAIDAGYPWTTSIPAGGDPAFDQHGRAIPLKPDSELDPETDIKFQYILNCWKELEEVRRIIIWTDWDSVGERLRLELSRRLGKIRCLFVPQPDDIAMNACVEYKKHDKEGRLIDQGMRPCKDVNEVLIHYGPERVLSIIHAAKPMPVSGLYKLSDFQEVTRVLYDTGFEGMNEVFSLYRGGFVVSSGLPQSGKSQFWNQIAFNMAKIHGWRIGMASFEAEVQPDLVRQLRAFYIDKDRREWNSYDRKHADEFIEEYFSFVTRDPQGIDDAMVTAEWLAAKQEECLIRHGLDMFITDPWNQMDHKRNPGERSDEYTMRAIRSIKDTGKRLDVCNVIIAHPDKAAGRESVKTGAIMGLYDMIDGSAWFNAAELGIIVHRRSPKEIQTRILAKKVKFRGTGRVGDIYLQFDELKELFDTRLLVMGNEIDDGPSAH